VNSAGESHAKLSGLVLRHVFNHQTHHRGQASTLLSQAGVDIGVTDLLELITDPVDPTATPDRPAPADR
jgi:uncharacterized damage-inducible protein DinB